MDSSETVNPIIYFLFILFYFLYLLSWLIVQTLITDWSFRDNQIWVKYVFQNVLHLYEY